MEAWRQTEQHWKRVLHKEMIRHWRHEIKRLEAMTDYWEREYYIASARRALARLEKKSA